MTSELIESTWDAVVESDEEKDEHEFWSRFGWARLAKEDRNTDHIPDEFKVDFGCPKCGSAWGELRSLGFIAPQAFAGKGVFIGRTPFVYPDPVDVTRVRAARLICLSGHTVDFDSLTRRTQVSMVPQGWILGPIVVGLLGAMAFAYTRKKS